MSTSEIIRPVREPWIRRFATVENPDLRSVLVEHAYRGIRVHLLLRALLVGFIVLVVAFVPPHRDGGWCVAIAVVYAAWAVAVLLLSRTGGERPVRFIWLALFVDLVALCAVTVVAGHSATQSWTADVLVNGFFLIPVIAATQLRPMVCAAVAGPTVAVYFGVSAATKVANTEPWASILLRSLVLAGVAVGCVLLSRVQRSRVLTIGGLVAERSSLLSELITLEQREQRNLAEALHDGALQYVLAARHDLDDARELHDPEAFERLDHALRESSQMLRSAVSELHPAVLEQSGLAPALRDLVRSAATRGGFIAEVDTASWGEDTRSSADAVLFATARELLSNVVRHAGATHCRIVLDWSGDWARLRVTDDGRGVGDGLLERRLGEGHIGVASRRLRVEAAGGTLTLQSALPRGTTAEVELPATISSPTRSP